MRYSLCGTPIHVGCDPSSATVDVASILERLFSLTPLQRASARDDLDISIRLGEPSVQHAAGEVVFEAPGLSAIRIEHGYHLQAQGAFFTLDLRVGKAAGSLSETTCTRTGRPLKLLGSTRAETGPKRLCAV